MTRVKETYQRNSLGMRGGLYCDRGKGIAAARDSEINQRIMKARIMSVTCTKTKLN
jgi:hypothetical protein